MPKGICHRCWMEGELMKEFPLSRSCYKKIPNVERRDLTVKSEYVKLARSWGGARWFNFLPIHYHYSPEVTLRWGEGKVDELDLAINIMTLACPPTEGYRRGTSECKIPHIKLAGGSIISQDVWNLHHFFRAEFIQSIPYEGGSINLREAKAWIERKTLFPVNAGEWTEGHLHA